MTPTAHKKALDGLNAIARKVFDHVPIQEAWPLNRIIQEMLRTSTGRLDLRTGEGCIERLKDVGLVKETERGLYQRVTPREPIKLPPVVDAERRPLPPPAPDPMVELGELSAGLRRQAAALLEQANRIDAAAFAFEERLEASEKRFAKFRELGAFLKEL